MPLINRRDGLAVALVASLALASPAAAAKTQPVDLRFAAVAGNTPVNCATPVTGLGSTNASARLQDFRFYVTGVRLVRSDGGTVGVKLARSRYQVSRRRSHVALIDLENGAGACSDEGTKAVNRSVKGTVPRGRYTGVRFTVGVPGFLNHTDLPAAPAPLNLSAMAWSWQFGRKFAKLDFTTDLGGGGHSAQHGHGTASKSFFIHLGSTGCVGNPAAGERPRCRAANRASVRIRRFDHKRQRIAVDIRKLVEGTDVTQNGGGAPGCMSGPTDPECPSVFKALGISWSNDGSAGGRSPVGRQSAFRAIG